MHSPSPFVFFSSACLGLFIILTVGAYYVPIVRQAAIKILLDKDRALSQANFNAFAAAQTAGAVRSVSSTPTFSTSSTPYSPQPASTTYPAMNGNVTKGAQYRLLKNVDECTFNTMGQDGWEAVEVGGNVDISSGRTPDCKSSGIVDTMDWVLFSRSR